MSSADGGDQQGQESKLSSADGAERRTNLPTAAGGDQVMMEARDRLFLATAMQMTDSLR